MSDALYQTRLRWTGGRGVAKLHGKAVALTSTPRLPSLPHIDSIDYCPEVGVAMVMPQYHGWREMVRAEVLECDALLKQLTEGASS